MSEEEFLKSTPRKIFKLVDIHIKLNSSEDEKKESKETYIDSIL